MVLGTSRSQNRLRYADWCLETQAKLYLQPPCASPEACPSNGAPVSRWLEPAVFECVHEVGRTAQPGAAVACQLGKLSIRKRLLATTTCTTVKPAAKMQAKRVSRRVAVRLRRQAAPSHRDRKHQENEEGSAPHEWQGNCKRMGIGKRCCCYRINTSKYHVHVHDARASPSKING